MLNYVERLKALIAARAGDLDPARREIERLSGYADGRMRFDRAALYAATGDPEGALDELRAAEELGFQAPQALAFDPDLRQLLNERVGPEQGRVEEIQRRWEGRRRDRAARWP